MSIRTMATPTLHSLPALLFVTRTLSRYFIHHYDDHIAMKHVSLKFRLLHRPLCYSTMVGLVKNCPLYI